MDIPGAVDTDRSLRPCPVSVVSLIIIEAKRRLCICPTDHTEAPPPPDKMTPPPKVLIQEDICSEICQSKESLTGLAEVPPPSHTYTGGSCCSASPERSGDAASCSPVDRLQTSRLHRFVSVLQVSP